MGPAGTPIGHIVNDDDVQTDALARFVIFALALLEQLVFPLSRAIFGPRATGQNVLDKLQTLESSNDYRFSTV